MGYLLRVALVIINHDIKQFIGNKNISTFSIADVNHCFNMANKYGTPTHANLVSIILIRLFEFAIKRGYVLPSDQSKPKD